MHASSLIESPFRRRTFLGQNFESSIRREKGTSSDASTTRYSEGRRLGGKHPCFTRKRIGGAVQGTCVTYFLPSTHMQMKPAHSQAWRQMLSPTLIDSCRTRMSTVQVKTSELFTGVRLLCLASTGNSAIQGHGKIASTQDDVFVHAIWSTPSSRSVKPMASRTSKAARTNEDS
jgi:hypothetical protein